MNLTAVDYNLVETGKIISVQQRDRFESPTSYDCRGLIRKREFLTPDGLQAVIHFGEVFVVQIEAERGRLWYNIDEPILVLPKATDWKDYNNTLLLLHRFHNTFTVAEQKTLVACLTPSEEDNSW